MQLTERELDDHIHAIRIICKGQWNVGGTVTLTTRPRHYGTVTGLVSTALLGRANDLGIINAPSRKLRLKVLEILIGRPILSSTLLTKWETQTLLDYLKVPGDERVRLSE